VNRIAGLLALAGALVVLPGCGSSSHRTAAAPDVLTAPVRLARTADGLVAYRELGSGAPLVLITGLGATMNDWEPSFVDALAARHRVVAFDNAGVGRSTPLPFPLSISGMANQTSDLISALGLGRTAVLGWSMGGMVAQALAALHPGQVSALVLAATQGASGRARPPSAQAAAAVTSADPLRLLAVLFPRGQATAAETYVSGIEQYPGAYRVSAAITAHQSAAIAPWFAGRIPAGHAALRLPVLVADGTRDRLDPVANDRTLAASVPGARLVLYPDAGHAFLFQDAVPFAAAVNRFLS
jgi:pimeloyl-ACP methyl ester carboxylesterase